MHAAFRARCLIQAGREAHADPALPLPTLTRATATSSKELFFQVGVHGGRRRTRWPQRPPLQVTCSRRPTDTPRSTEARGLCLCTGTRRCLSRQATGWQEARRHGPDHRRMRRLRQIASAHKLCVPRRRRVPSLCRPARRGTGHPPSSGHCQASCCHPPPHRRHRQITARRARQTISEPAGTGQRQARELMLPVPCKRTQNAHASFCPPSRRHGWMRRRQPGKLRQRRTWTGQAGTQSSRC